MALFLSLKLYILQIIYNNCRDLAMFIQKTFSCYVIKLIPLYNKTPEIFIYLLVYVPIKNNELHMTVSILYKIHTESKYTSLHNP